MAAGLFVVLLVVIFRFVEAADRPNFGRDLPIAMLLLLGHRSERGAPLHVVQVWPASDVRSTCGLPGTLSPVLTHQWRASRKYQTGKSPTGRTFS